MTLKGVMKFYDLSTILPPKCRFYLSFPLLSVPIHGTDIRAQRTLLTPLLQVIIADILVPIVPTLFLLSVDCAEATPLVTKHLAGAPPVGYHT